MAQRPANIASTKGQRCTADIPGLGMVDGRTREARLYGLAVQDITDDLGGQDQLSRAELELARRAVGLSVLAAMAESRLLTGDEINIAELVSVGNAQRRILATLGLKRVARDVPDLRDWLRQRETDAA